MNVALILRRLIRWRIAYSRRLGVRFLASVFVLMVLGETVSEAFAPEPMPPWGRGLMDALWFTFAVIAIARRSKKGKT